MDELPVSLSALLNEARSAHDPQPHDARRVALRLSAMIPAFQPWAGLASSAGSASGATGAGGGAGSAMGSAVTHAAGGVSVKAAAAAGLSSGLAKGLSVLIVASAAGASIAIRNPEPPRTATHVSSTSAQVAHERERPAPREPAALTEPASPQPVAREVTSAARIIPEPPSSRAVAPVITRDTPTRRVHSTASAELPLIRGAAQALRDGDAAHALQLLDRHAVESPDGMLAEEREGLRVLALCEQGRLSEARGLRDRFLAHAPASPLAGRVERACPDPVPLPEPQTPR